MVTSSGQELLLDLHGCVTEALNDPRALEEILRAAARAAGFEVVSHVVHQFSHRGVTLVLILSQSHIALHTWPEERFAAVDVYVCGEQPAILRALESVRENLVTRFGAASHQSWLIDRARADGEIIPRHLDIVGKQD